MERAGGCVFEILRQRWPRANAVTVVCGTGNNGGDGFVVARRAREAGLSVVTLLIGDRAQIAGDALHHLMLCEAAGVQPAKFDGQLPENADLIVDALFGTGLTRAVEGAYAQAITTLNDSGRPIIAVDIPSGVNADTGARMGVAVRADATVTFIGMKQGLLTGDAPDFTGVIYFADLEVPAAVYAKVKPTAQRVDRQQLLGLLPRRARTGHKGHYGHVLVVGGESGYAGAVRMAGEAAMRVGAGLVSIATRAGHAATIASRCPVLMCHGVADADALAPLTALARVIAIGPGLGRSPWAQALLARVLECRQPLVVDADALNLLAEEPAKQDEWILTPHPGEAARLLGSDVSTIQANRFAAARQIQQRYGGVCVLKGAGTIVAADDFTGVCSAGNPGMGSGGMGDILTGVIAGLLAQGMSLRDAAQLGVCLHAEAGDAAAADGERGLVATDLLPWLRRLANA
ncbi:MAG: NAD(P)H-hydrate dehydratase [Gammaproteobacteria bacterium]